MLSSSLIKQLASGSTVTNRFEDLIEVCLTHVKPSMSR